MLGYLYRAADPDARPVGPELGALKLLGQGVRDIVASARLDQVLQAQVDSLSAELESLRPADVSNLSEAELADLLAGTQRTGDALADQGIFIAETIQSLNAILAQMHRRWTDGASGLVNRAE